jgi:ABC-type multidrug transport system fused ATPase/permease subunit
MEKGIINMNKNSKIGYISQENWIINGSIEENIRMGNDSK